MLHKSHFFEENTAIIPLRFAVTIIKLEVAIYFAVSKAPARNDFKDGTY